VSEAIPSAGALANCERCGVILRVASVRNTEVGPLGVRLAKKPEGVCASCNVRQWFATKGKFLELDQSNLPAALLLPHVQDVYGQLLIAANSDAGAVQGIDWKKVVADWDLPVRVKAKRKHKGGTL
jgi:hypothetical protein